MALEEEGKDEVYHTAEELAHVQLDDSLRDQQPLPQAVQRPIGPTEGHKTKPRKLELDEFYHRGG